MEQVKILGAASSGATTQTHEFELPDNSSLRLLITIHSSEPSLARIEAIRGAVNFLHHEVSKTDFDFNHLKECIQKTFATPHFDAAVAYITDSTLYAFAIGKTQVYLLRNGILSPLLPGGDSLHAASGYLQKDDMCILATEAFLQLVPVSELTGYVRGRRLLALEEDTATRIEQSEISGEAGIVMIAHSLSEEGETAEPREATVGSAQAAQYKEEHATEVAEAEVVDQMDEVDEELVEEEDEDSYESTDESVLEETEAQDQEENEEEILDVESGSGADAPQLMEDEEPVTAVPSNTFLNKRQFFARSDERYDARGKSKRLAYIGAILILFLGVSIYFGANARRAKEEDARIKAVITSAQEALTEARSLASVNKARARDLIVNARAEVLGVQTEKEIPEINSLRDALTESLGEVAGVYEVAPETFSDLTLISQNLKADSLSISENKLRVLARDEKRVVQIELPGKRTDTLSGGRDLSNLTQVSAYAKRNFVIAQDGIYDITTSAAKQVDLPTDPGNLLLGTFAGNIYLVDKSANQVWRYPGDGTSFGERGAWLTEGTQVDFSKAKSIGIDGSIWVFTGSDRLQKLTIGNAQMVSLRGMSETPTESARFFTDSDSASLYLLDPERKTLFVFEKEGELVATYMHPELARATDLVVSEENKLILLAAGSKILSLQAKHIK